MEVERNSMNIAVHEFMISLQFSNIVNNRDLLLCKDYKEDEYEKSVIIIGKWI